MSGCGCLGEFLIPIGSESGSGDGVADRIVFDVMARRVYRVNDAANDSTGTANWHNAIEQYGAPYALRRVEWNAYWNLSVEEVQATPLVMSGTIVPAQNLGWRFYYGKGELLIGSYGTTSAPVKFPVDMRIPNASGLGWGILPLAGAAIAFTAWFEFRAPCPCHPGLWGQAPSQPIQFQAQPVKPTK